MYIYYSSLQYHMFFKFICLVGSDSSTFQNSKREHNVTASQVIWLSKTLVFYQFCNIWTLNNLLQNMNNIFSSLTSFLYRNNHRKVVILKKSRPSLKYFLDARKILIQKMPSRGGGGFLRFTPSLTYWLIHLLTWYHPPPPPLLLLGIKLLILLLFLCIKLRDNGTLTCQKSKLFVISLITTGGGVYVIS